MIDLLPDEHVQELIKQRKRIFKLDSNYYVFTPANHAFYFWSDGDVSICDPFNSYRSSFYQPKVAKLYGVEYDSENSLIKNSGTRKHLYDLFINDPACMFFIGWYELQQELQHRGLI